MDYRIRNASYADTPDNVSPSYDSYPIIRDNKEFGSIGSDMSMIVDMFEETNGGCYGYDCETIANDYVRDQIKSWGPDTNLMAHEEGRGAVNKNCGMIQLRGHGTRGNIDNPYRPELFLGFLGNANDPNSDFEPRGIAVDPDDSKRAAQHAVRAKYIRLSADNSDFVIDGVRAERREIKDKQDLLKITRDRLRVFDRQIDGRTEGKSMSKHDQKSNVCKQVNIQSYGDLITDNALGKARKANVICDNIIRDQKEYRDSASDQDRDFMRYTQICKSGPLKTEKKVLNGLVSSTSDFGQGTRTKSYKALGIRMRDIVQARSNLIADTDSDLASSKNTAISKTAPIQRDILIITQSIDQESRFNSSDLTQSSKTASPQQRVQQINRIENDRYLAPMHFNNVLVIAKAAKLGNLREARNNIINDSEAPVPIDANARGKSSNQTIKSGININADHDTDATQSKNTVKYKTNLILENQSKMNNLNGENFTDESDFSQNRKTTGCSWDSSNVNTDVGIGFGDSGTKDRHGSGLGSKYTMRHMQTDNRDIISF